MTALSWKSAVSGDWTTSADWTNGTTTGFVPGSGDAVTISVASGTTAYTVTVSTADAAGSITLNNKNATLAVASGGTLTVGTTLTDTAGTVSVAGEIIGGTLSAGSSGKYVWGSVSGGTTAVLSNVTYSGTLAIGGNQDLAIAATGNAGSSGLVASAITDNGFDSGTGNGSVLAFDDSQTFNNATITLGNASAQSVLEQFDTGSDTAGTLTFGSSLIINTAGQADITSASGSGNDLIINQGTINASSSILNINPDNFENFGAINITKGTTDIEVNSFVNESNATITVGNGTTKGVLLVGESGGATWQNSGAIVIDSSSTLDLGINTTTAGLGSITSNGGTISFDGTINNAGASLAVGSGTQLGTTIVTGEIDGGTITDAGSGMTFSSAVFGDGVVYDGTVNLSTSSASLEVTGAGLTVNQSATVSGNGTINLTGAGSTLRLDDSQTLNNGTLDIGSNSPSGVTLFQNDSVPGVSGTLTLGANLAIVQTGKNGEITTANGGGSGDSVVIAGAILANVSGGDLTIDPDDLTVENTITVSNGDELDLTPDDNLSISGNISVSGTGSDLALGADSQFSNTGSITVSSGATLELQSKVVTLSTLGNLSNSGTISFENVFDLGGGTLSIGGSGVAGSLGTAVLNGGTLQNGTILDNGSGLSFASGVEGLLSNIVYDGTINIGAGSLIVVSGPLTVNNLAGTGAGTVNLTGASATLAFNGTTSINNATIDIGSNIANSSPILEELGTDNVVGGPGNTLTFGSGLVIDQTGKLATITTISNSYTDAIVNDGTINATLAGATLTINPANLTNGGLLNLANSGLVDIEASPGTAAHGELTTFLNGSTGSVSIGSGSMLTVGTNALTDSEMSWSNAGFIGGAGGTGMVGGLISGIAFSNSGTIDLAGGTLTTPSVTNNGTAGLLEGAGTISGAVVGNGGEIEALGGTLTVTGAVTGTGTAVVGNGATQVFDSSVASGTAVSFATASGTLKLVAPGSFQGTLAGAAVGDVIDLVNTKATSLTYNNGQVVVTNGSTMVASFGLSGSAADLDYTFGTDGNNGTDITMTADQPPVTTVPGAQSVNAGTATALSRNISVSDGDAVAAGETITVVLSDATGILAATNSGGGTVTGSGTTSLTISGCLSQVNNDLTTLTYDGATGPTTSDKINVATSDGRGGSNNQSIAVAVEQTFQAPVTTVPGAQSVIAGKAGALSSNISVSDGNAGVKVTVELTDTTGTLSATIDAIGGGGSVTGSGSNDLIISGTLSQVNADLGTLTYDGAKGTTTSDTINVATSDSDGGSNNQSIAVSVDQPPTMTAPHKETAYTRTPLAISGVVVNDPTASGSETFSILVFDQEGSLSATATDGGNVKQINAKRLEVTGTLAEINATLATLTYTAGRSAGSDTITVHTVDEQGATSTHKIAVTVDERNPVTTVPGAQTVTEGVSTPVSGVSVGDHYATLNHDTVTVTLTDAKGELDATHAGGGTVTGSGTKDLVITGTLNQVNKDLATLAYVGEAVGSDTIRILTQDSGGGIDRATIGVTVNAAGGSALLVQQMASFDSNDGASSMAFTSSGVTQNDTLLAVGH